VRAGIFIVSIVAAAVPPHIPHQQTTVTVAVAVAVEHRDGRPVEGLTAGDFSLLLDGQPVTVTKATYDSTSPNVAVLLDLTASNVWPGGASIRDHVLAVFSDNTAVIVGTFGRVVRWSGGFSTDRSEQRRLLQTALGLRPEERTGPSPVWDVVSDALAALHSRQGRKAVLLITDGQTTGNRLGLADVADQAIASAVPVNIIFSGSSRLLNQALGMTARVLPDRPLSQLAGATGGYFSAILKDKADALRMTARAMRSVYRLEFMAPSKPGFQRLLVATKNSDHLPRAPMGFKSGS
jgi:hypothetical protein